MISYMASSRCVDVSLEWIAVRPISEELLQALSLVVLTDTPQKELLRLNRLARSAQSPVGFIAADCFGPLGPAVHTGLHISICIYMYTYMYIYICIYTFI